jgi:hypothetical protein
MSYQLIKKNSCIGFVKVDIVTGHWKILHNEELYNLRSWPNIWVIHNDQMGETSGTHAGQTEIYTGFWW